MSLSKQEVDEIVNQNHATLAKSCVVLKKDNKEKDMRLQAVINVANQLELEHDHLSNKVEYYEEKYGVTENTDFISKVSNSLVVANGKLNSKTQKRLEEELQRLRRS